MSERTEQVEDNGWPEFAAAATDLARAGWHLATAMWHLVEATFALVLVVAGAFTLIMLATR